MKEHGRDGITNPLHEISQMCVPFTDRDTEHCKILMELFQLCKQN